MRTGEKKEEEDAPQPPQRKPMTLQSDDKRWEKVGVCVSPKSVISVDLLSVSRSERTALVGFTFNSCHVLKVRRPRTDQATAPLHASGQRSALPTTSPVVEGPRLAGRPPKARTMSSELEQTEAEMKGWLAKWTNYLKGYQKRWFVLSNGLLSYYRNQAEMAHTCRGTISLVSAVIHTEDSCNFVISNGGTQTFHLKASNEIERQKWVTALELAKARAVRMMESEEDEELDMPSQLDKSELLTVLRLLHVKLEDLSMCSDLIAKHGAALQRSLTDLEQLEGGPGPEAAARVRAVNERATLFRITSTAMMNACSEYVQLAQSQGRKW
ncbi:hypothetical protein ISCGN_008465, partial [Ixodes scapularis]